jgi:succinylarginine dihydrolase
MTERWTEIQIDGLIGPTHHFGGLGVGNIASQESRWRPSHPRGAALEGLRKMETIATLGVPQFFLPPLTRPDWAFLEQLGYRGPRSDVLKRCGNEAPQLLSAAYSSSFMWTANAATTSPGLDTTDGKCRAVIANLCSSLHRGIEGQARWQQIRHWLAEIPEIEVHSPLPSVHALRDEGAANHMRLFGESPHEPGFHVFVHEPKAHPQPANTEQVDAPKYHSRQGELASACTAQSLQLSSGRYGFLEQTQKSIDAGVFHNDVIAISHGSWLFCHEDAFVNQTEQLNSLRIAFERCTSCSLNVVEVARRQLPLEEAVRTYLFNSQLVSRSDGAMHLVCPRQCSESMAVRSIIDSWIADPEIPIQGVTYVALSESMANGGGPACLRLRWTLPERILQGAIENWRWTPERGDRIQRWVETYYAEQLQFEDFQRLEFAEHAHAAIASFPA